jgi:CRP-like cAMP-binding protein
MKVQDSHLFRNTTLPINSISQNQFPPGYTIAYEGSVSTYVGIVLKGSIDVNAYTPNGNVIHINTLREGMTYGDVLLYGSHNTYPGDLITKETTLIAMVPNELIKHFLHDDPIFLANFMTALSGKVHYYNSQAKLLAQDSLRDKILYFLHTEQVRQKSNTIQLNMSKQELAEKLHVQRPSLSRELIKMKQEGIIDYDRWSITLK